MGRSCFARHSESLEKVVRALSELFEQCCITRNCLWDNSFDHAATDCQLHGFCDASDSAFCCVVYLRCSAVGKPVVSFVLGKPKLVLAHQTNWVITRKELEAAKLCSEVMLSAEQLVLRDFNRSLHFWTNSCVVLD